MEQQTWIEVLKERTKDQLAYANACMVEALVMEKCLGRIERGEVEPSRLEKDATLTHTVLGQGEARKRELPGPGTIGAMVRKVMKELTARKKGVPITNEEIITFTQVEMPHANPSSIKSYVYNNQNDIRRKRDIRNVGPGSWVLDETRMLEHKRKPTEDEVQDTAAMVMRQNKDTSPFTGYKPTSTAGRALMAMQEDPSKQWKNRELARKLNVSEGSLAFLYQDQYREDCPYKQTAPGTWQYKRVRQEHEESSNGNGKKPRAVRTPAQRAHMAKVMKASYKKRAADRKKAEEEKLEKLEKREMVKA